MDTIPRVIELLRECLEASGKVVGSDAITPTADFWKDLGLDSLDARDLFLRVSDEFGIAIPEKRFASLNSVQKVVDFVGAPKA
jgi:acyl carrier protein